MNKQLLTTLHHFARCWCHLRRTSSRRTLEVGLAALYASQILRLMQAMRWIPLFPGLGSTPDNSVARLVVAGDQFYADLWPSPIFWMVILSAGILLTAAGMLQTVAAVNTTRAGRSPLLLSEGGEDDPHFLTSVSAEDLLWDIRLRRGGMAMGIAFFATIGWNLLWKAGLVALIFIVLLFLCSQVDDRLRETGRKLSELIEKQRKAERDAYIQMVTGRTAR